MRLVCLHTDTVDALKRLRIEFDDLTPSGLWSTPYHLVGLTRDQLDALDVFRIEVEDITPAQLAQGGQEQPARAPGEVAAGGARPTPGRSETPASTADAIGREPPRVAAVAESEVPLAQGRDAVAKGGEAMADTKGEPKPDGKTTTQVSAETAAPQGTGPASGGQQGAAQRVAVKGGGAQVAPPAQANRKGQPAQGPTGGQRYGTTRLRISVAGKYTEATVANGKIVIGGRTFDSPDQAAAELTKSRGDWTFWEYYDSTDGKWRMLTRDWDTVLKSAAPGGR
jgi:hypothetical protein